LARAGVLLGIDGLDGLLNGGRKPTAEGFFGQAGQLAYYKSDSFPDFFLKFTTHNYPLGC
jgi:hypothetical protein